MIPFSSASIETFTPPSLKGQKPQPLFHFSAPTPDDRDKVDYRLIAAGVILYSGQEIRNRLIHEIFQSLPDDEEEAERRATLIEEGTQDDLLFEERMTGWRERERERLRDFLEGAPERESEPLPKRDMPLRRRTEYEMMWADAIRGSERLTEMVNANQEYASDQRKMVARFHLVGWEGLKAQREALATIKGLDVVTVESMNAMRAEIGEVAWRELLDHAISLYNLSRVETGNSESPPVNSLNQSGSEDRSGGSVTPGGASMKRAKRTNGRSNTTPTPADGSQPTPALSSGSSSGSGTRKAASRRGRTGAGL